MGRNELTREALLENACTGEEIEQLDIGDLN